MFFYLAQCFIVGHDVVQLADARRYKPEGRVFDCRN